MNDESSPRLGMELSRSEERCYRIIRSSGVCLISPDKIAEQYFHKTKTGQPEKAAVQVLIRAIRQKLGNSEIITAYKTGYVSRRMLINEMVANGGNIGINDITGRLKD